MRSARVKAGLSMPLTAAPAHVRKLGPESFRSRGQRLPLGGLVQGRSAPNRCAHSAFSSAQAGARLARPGGFWPARAVPGWAFRRRRRSDSVRPTAQLGDRCEAAAISSGSTRQARPSPSADPTFPSDAQRGVQPSPQRGLVDDPGGPGFMPERVTVDGHQRASARACLLGTNTWGVQVRIPGPRGLVLVAAATRPGSRCRSFIPVMLLCTPGVAGGCAGTQASATARLWASLLPWTPPWWCPRRAATTPTSGRKSQIESVVGALRKLCVHMLHQGPPSSSQRATTSRSGLTAGPICGTQTAQRGAGFSVSGAHPKRCSGPFGVVLPSPPPAFSIQRCGNRRARCRCSSAPTTASAARSSTRVTTNQPGVGAGRAPHRCFHTLVQNNASGLMA